MAEPINSSPSTQDRSKRFAIGACFFIGILFLVLGLIGAGIATARMESAVAETLNALATVIATLTHAPVWISCIVIGIVLLLLGNHLRNSHN